MNKEYVFAEELLKVAQADPTSCFLFMDGMEFVYASCLKGKISSDRIVNLGISEQNAVSFAAGLSLTGKNVYLVGVSFFLSTRGYEQIRNDIAVNNANVKILATKSGIASCANGGVSHWAYDDIALVRNLPNMRIANCATSDAVHHYMMESVRHKGPMYIMDECCWLKQDLHYPLRSDRIATVLPGDDLAILTTGNGVFAGLRLCRELSAAGYSAALCDVHSIRPFDEGKVRELVDAKMPIVVIDEHSSGGLCDIVSEVIARYGKAAHYLPVCIRKVWPIVGEYEYVAEQFLNYRTLCERVIRFLPMTPKRLLKRLNPIQHRVRFQKGDIPVKCLCFLGIPLVRSVPRPRAKKGRLKNRYYLLGFLRIA